MRPTFSGKAQRRIVLPDTGLSNAIANAIAASRTDVVFDELRILDEMSIAWWQSKHYLSMDNDRKLIPLDVALSNDIDSLITAIDSQFDGISDEEMDRDMEYYEENNLAHRLVDLSYHMASMAGLINNTFNVAFLSGVNLDDANIVGIEKAGPYPIMFIE